jgi:ubiquinone/menaquinone biosynthesis C-methylase UbiE
MSSIAPETTGISENDLWRCVACGGAAEMAGGGERLACPTCGRSYPIEAGVLVVHDPKEIKDNNRVAATFYDSPLWPKFRFWEWVTFLCNGGERRSRNKILRHLPDLDGIRLLDVAIGDGVYLPWLQKSWSVVGVDLSRSQLSACQKRDSGPSLRLILGEAENLPVRDATFDAALSIGGFNYFNDPEKALCEMARVVKPGGTIVVSDEVPNLTDRMFFRKIGLPGVDRWIISKMLHLGDDFTDMVERYRSLDVEAIGRRVLPGCRYERIWHGVGYVLIGTVPS